MTITTIIIHNSICLVNENQGSSFALPAHGWVGARATSSLAAHFALRNTASNSAEKKGSPSKGVAEGGGWGEEFRHARAEVKRFRHPAVGGTSKQNNFLFNSLIFRATLFLLKGFENCFALLAEFRRAETLGRGFKSFERLSLEKGSSFVQQLRLFEASTELSRSPSSKSSTFEIGEKP